MQMDTETILRWGGSLVGGGICYGLLQQLIKLVGTVRGTDNNQPVPAAMQMELRSAMREVLQQMVMPILDRQTQILDTLTKMQQKMLELQNRDVGMQEGSQGKAKGAGVV